MNQELLDEMKENMVSIIKQQRSKWLGHIWTAALTTKINSILEWKAEGRRKLGKHRSKWFEEGTHNPTKVGMRNWKNENTDRRI